MENQTVHVVILEVDGWEDHIKGIFLDPLNAEKCKAEQEASLKRLRWDDAEIIIRPWTLDDP